MTITANLINAETGANTLLSIMLQERRRAGNIDLFFFSVPLEAIGAGDYVVYFHALGQGIGMAAHAFTTLSLKR